MASVALSMLRCLSGSSERAASVRKGHLPHSISYSRQPKLHQSTAKLYVWRFPSTCSDLRVRT
jgi:hypothetical protein